MKTRPMRPFPQVSLQKETALLLIEQGFSFRKVSKALSLNVTIITQWSKRDPEFKKLLDRIEMEKQLAYRKMALSYPVYDALDPLHEFQAKIERAYQYGGLQLSREELEEIRAKLASLHALLASKQKSAEDLPPTSHQMHQLECAM